MRNIIILALLVFVLLIPYLAFAQEVDCPYGLVNDPAPGRCSRYVDLNNNNICDLSEPSLTKVALGRATDANPGIALSTPMPATQETTVMRYKLLPITVTLVILYLFTYILVLKKKITLLMHHRIWNVLLLLAFLPTLILGLLLIIQINRGWALDLPFNMLYWHVELGTAMAIISIFHIAWHWRYYVIMFKKRKS